MQVTDEMVERALDRWFNDDRAWRNNKEYVLKVMRRDMRAALESIFPRTPPDPPGATVEVRIACAVDRLGQWAAHGIWRHSDTQNRENIFVDDLENGEAYFWITARVPLPVAVEVEGRVE